MPLSFLRPQLWFSKVKGAFKLIFGKVTLVGYIPNQTAKLPNLKPGLLFPAKKVDESSDIHTIERVNFLYAKDYSPNIDMELFLRNLKKLVF